MMVAKSNITAIPQQQYVYRAAVKNVHDGDTCTILADVGFDVQVSVDIRVLGINAPEIATPSGKVSQQFALSWLMAAGSDEWPLIISSTKSIRPINPDKFGGRWDALVYRKSDNGELGAAMVAAKMALPWNGSGVKPV